MIVDKKKEILVSIICIAYNHEKYIRFALNGFLMQKTNFKYEILVHDDASTDNTAMILKEYQDKYPDLIHVVYQKENQHSKGNSPIMILLEQARGKYLAFCEGDDYWIDDKKLQRQVDFLINNIEYGAIYHNVDIVDEENVIFYDNDAQNTFPKYQSYTLEKNKLLIGYITGQLGTLVCRNFYINFTQKDKLAYRNCKANGDTKINLLLNSIGKIKYIEDIMSCYRRTYIGDSYNARNKNKDFSSIRLKNIYELSKMIEDIFCMKISSGRIKDSIYRLTGDYLIDFIKSRTKVKFYIFLNLYRMLDNKLAFNGYFVMRMMRYILKKLKLVEILPQNECIIDKK